MTNTYDHQAESSSGYFSVSNVTSFVTKWFGGGGNQPQPQPTREQEQQAEETQQVGKSWGLVYSKANLMNALLFAAKQLSTIVPQPAEEVKSDLTLDGYEPKLENGDILELKDIKAERLGYALFDLSTFDVCVVEMDALKVGRIAYKTKLVHVEASVTLRKLKLKVGATEVVRGVGIAFGAGVSSVADEVIGIADDEMEGGELDMSQVLPSLKSTVMEEIMAHLRVSLGVSIESIDLKLTVHKFGRSNAPLDVMGKLKTAGLMGKHLKELDLSIGKVSIEVEKPDDEEGGIGFVDIKDTHLKLGIEDGQIETVIATKIDLTGMLKAKVEDVVCEVFLRASAEINLEQPAARLEPTLANISGANLQNYVCKAELVFVVCEWLLKPAEAHMFLSAPTPHSGGRAHPGCACTSSGI